jgi:hypothetical protein
MGVVGSSGRSVLSSLCADVWPRYLLDAQGGMGSTTLNANLNQDR